MPPATAVWRGEPTRLDRAVCELALARSRSHAAELIQAGKVAVNAVPVTKAGAKLSTGAAVRVLSPDHYVSRGAHKLVAALAAFALEPAGKLALDLGAATGGFTQVLLERGAAQVVALDVGHNQLVPALRADPRVVVVEGYNARGLDLPSFTQMLGARALDSGGQPRTPEIIVGDLSFISLELILPAIARISAPATEIVLLVKPQFEVGRVRGGVVTDPALWEKAIRQVLQAAAGEGLQICALTVSPVLGGRGNCEFLAHFKLALGTIPPDLGEWEQRLGAVVQNAIADKRSGQL